MKNLMELVPAAVRAERVKLKATALSEKYGVSRAAAREYLEEFFLQKDYYPCIPLSVSEERVLLLCAGCALSRAEAKEEIAILKAKGVEDTRKLPKEFWTVYFSELTQGDFSVKYLLSLAKLIRKKGLDAKECCEVAVWASVCGRSERDVLKDYDATCAAMKEDRASAGRRTYHDDAEHIWELSEEDYYGGERYGLYA